jgi:predicted transcriptional regulator
MAVPKRQENDGTTSGRQRIVADFSPDRHATPSTVVAVKSFADPPGMEFLPTGRLLAFHRCLACVCVKRNKVLDTARQNGTMKPNLKNQILLLPRPASATMARPPAKELTERELEIMHIFWRHGPLTATAVRDHLEGDGRELAYTTVATLVRILVDKGYLKPINRQRPFEFRPVRSFQEVSQRIVGDLVERVFHGSRSQLLLQLMEDGELTAAERAVLERIVREAS